jgi:hypothetical protein
LSGQKGPYAMVSAIGIARLVNVEFLVVLGRVAPPLSPGSAASAPSCVEPLRCRSL